MPRRKVRKIRQEARASHHEKAVVELREVSRTAYGKDHLVPKIICLIAPTASEAKKSAGKMISAFIAALGHLFAEGDVNIPDFGLLEANMVNNRVKVTFTPAKKFEKCAEARLSQPAQQAQTATSSSDPAQIPDSGTAQAPASTTDSSAGSVPEARSALSEPDTALPDVALGKTVLSSGGLPGQEADMMVDGNQDTRWISGHAVPAWAVVDLGRVVTSIKKIVVRMPEDVSCAYKLQSTAGGPWGLIGEMPMGRHPEVGFDVDLHANHVQLTISESDAQLSWAHVIGIEIHGQPA